MAWRYKMFDAKLEVKRLKQQAKEKRGIRYYPSRLDKVGLEIIRMREEKASFQMIQQSLYERHNIEVESSTIYRWVKRHG